ncbi:uncharacterized protein LOC128951640 [Oppia nitens]|uniref:uncharacterized protein LOC128951640 n=1 Tax=Oppia nitens TaxID=1686743 RepID=UPI0023D9BC0E|nr:uncharacterized protein LOC128951640 [Oppia nitens]
MWAYVRFLLLISLLSALVVVSTTGLQKGGRQTGLSSPFRPLRDRTAQASDDIQQQVQEPDREVDEDRDVVAAVIPTRRPSSRPPPPSRPQPQRPEESGGEADPGDHEPLPEPYKFSYSVDDPDTGASSSREESQDANGEIVGFYNIKDADGRTRRVDYTAGKDGFKATIKSNEEGLNSRAPADVNIELSGQPSERIASYAPNNRPNTPSGISLRPLAPAAAPVAYQRVVAAAPPAAAAPVAYQRVVAAPPAAVAAPVAQASDDSQRYETESIFDSQPSESSAPVTQQHITDDDHIVDESPAESAPVVKSPPPPPPPSPTLTNVFRKRVIVHRPPPPASVAIQQQREQQLAEPTANSVQRFEPQLKEEDIPNSIQDIQRVEESAPVVRAPTKSVVRQQQPQQRQTAYPAILSPLLGAPVVQQQQQQRIPTVQPLFNQYFIRGGHGPNAGAAAITTTSTVTQQQQPTVPTNNNIFFLQQQYHQLKAQVPQPQPQPQQQQQQQQLLELIHPVQTATTTTADRPLVFEQQSHQPIQLFSAFDNSRLAYIPTQQQQQLPVQQQVERLEQVKEDTVPQPLVQQPQPQQLQQPFTLIFRHREEGQQQQQRPVAPVAPVVQRLVESDDIVEQQKISTDSDPTDQQLAQAQVLQPQSQQQLYQQFLLPTVPIVRQHQPVVQYQPLAAAPVVQQQREDPQQISWEPQLYEPLIQQQQPQRLSSSQLVSGDDIDDEREPVDESQSAPVLPQQQQQQCECAKHQQQQQQRGAPVAESVRIDAVKGQSSAPAATAVKGRQQSGSGSSVHQFLPHAYRKLIN